jgi:hypothetical protein
MRLFACIQRHGLKGLPQIVNLVSTSDWQIRKKSLICSHTQTLIPDKILQSMRSYARPGRSNHFVIAMIGVPIVATTRRREIFSNFFQLAAERSGIAITPV